MIATPAPLARAETQPQGVRNCLLGWATPAAEVKRQVPGRRPLEHVRVQVPAAAPTPVGARARFRARPETTVKPEGLEAEPEQHPQQPTRSGSPRQTPEAIPRSSAHRPPQQPTTPPRLKLEQRRPRATAASPRQALPHPRCDQTPSTPAPTPAQRNVPAQQPDSGMRTILIPQEMRCRLIDQLNRRYRLASVTLRRRHWAQPRESKTQRTATLKGWWDYHSPEMNRCWETFRRGSSMPRAQTCRVHCQSPLPRPRRCLPGWLLRCRVRCRYRWCCSREWLLRCRVVGQRRWGCSPGWLLVCRVRCRYRWC